MKIIKEIFCRYVFTIGDGCVYVWIVKTGECLRLINHNSNSNDQEIIVSICINPHNRLQLCVAQLNGIINVWDYEDGILIHVILFYFCKIIYLFIYLDN